VTAVILAMPLPAVPVIVIVVIAVMVITIVARGAAGILLRTGDHENQARIILS
jgi:hypothetical protein